MRLADHQVFRYHSTARRMSSGSSSSSTCRGCDPARRSRSSPIASRPVLRYARTIHVIYDRAVRPPSGWAPPFRQPVAEERVPPGTLTYAGVVFRLSGERLVLHTRDGREQALLLRKDTRYLRNGEIVDPATLAN